MLTSAMLTPALRTENALQKENMLAVQDLDILKASACLASNGAFSIAAFPLSSSKIGETEVAAELALLVQFLVGVAFPGSISAKKRLSEMQPARLAVFIRVAVRSAGIELTLQPSPWSNRILRTLSLKLG